MPEYFHRFQCLAGACPDSCCQGWEVQVDADSAARYRALPGALGDCLRAALRDADGETLMTLAEGRCPMWRRDGLCRIQAELGEDALCRTCQEFPRLTHDYGDFRELGLELSCPEAARLILTAAPAPLLVEDRPESGEAQYDQEAMALLKASREQALALLSEERRPMGQRLALLLLFGCQTQSALDGGEPAPFSPEDALETAKALAKPSSSQALPDFFLGLELLTPEWERRLRSPDPGPWDGRTAALARYFVQRYWLQAVSDYDLYSRVKFTVLACLLIREVGRDFLRTAQLFSKEIENDVDNVDALLDAAYTHPAFTDDKLLGMLLA